MKTLIIAEKPSVAKDIANALGVTRQGNIYENAELVISNCVGHLVEIDVPEAEDRKILPIIPQSFALKAVSKTKDQFKTVKELMLRKDVGLIVNACDAGREGEVIFRFTYELAKCAKPSERLWLQTMTKGGILKAWQEKASSSKYDGLWDAGRSRREADWLFGINGSRATFTQVGRVMSPTLAMVVRAYLAHTNFASKEYYEVHGTFKISSGDYTAKWVPSNRVDSDGEDKEEESARFTNREKAQLIVDKCAGIDPSSVRDTSKIMKSAPPSLFDLTTLQREANRLFKFSAAKTLTIAQALYETHKVTSYPRTDSSHLPEDYVSKCAQVVVILGNKIPALQVHAERVIENDWVQPIKRIFNNEKISDHFAIIPTGNISNALDESEQKIFNLICKRFLAAFHPDAEFSQTVRITVVNDETFRVSGKVLIKAGWREVYGSQVSDSSEKEPALMPLVPGEQAKGVSMIIKECKTKAPPLLTEATLLRSMETAGKTIEDQEIADALKGKGIGTPATRAATIEKLKETKGFEGKTKEPFMTTEKNFLIPTGKGLNIVSYLDGAYPALTSASLTGEWETRLSLVERGDLARSVFMEDARSATLDMVNKIIASPPERSFNQVGNAPPPEGAKMLGACPICASGVYDHGIKYSCACGFTVWKVIAKKKLLIKDLKELLQNGKTGKIEGFTSKAGKKFNASLAVDKERLGVSFVF